MISDPEKKMGKVIKDRPTDSAEARKVIEECRKSYQDIINCSLKQIKPEYSDLKWNTPKRKTEQ